MKHWRAILLMAVAPCACSKEAPKACSPPRSEWGKPRSFELIVLNKIALDRTGRTYWNGKQVSRETLDEYLVLGTRLNPEPWVFLETEMGASCASIEAIRDQVEKRVDCATGYRCNEGIMTIWENMAISSTTPAS
ncbi:hypothetical protein [Sphingomonas sp.]|jgi:hypothetical protein|uniref:hypothetical protein n=1 Tax=Sphingomonas sp. TaxID=28214 RepID=UPI002D80C50A|nr:hypothetical protein [Sphingomonas sp.]HEU0043393.1 hypothetical protein [Sphingomonas sp.]